jgi:small subunit ribosomal protein S13
LGRLCLRGLDPFWASLADHPPPRHHKVTIPKGGTPMADEEKQSKKKTGKKVATPQDEDFKHLVRIAATDLPGTKPVLVALTGIKGVGNRLAPLIADRANVKRDEKIGNLSDEEVERIAGLVENIGEEVPAWMRNRQRDPESGEDIHHVGPNIEIVVKDDINRLKKIRAYRGVRHEHNLPVRGQRTRANNRSGITVGVQRKK